MRIWLYKERICDIYVLMLNHLKGRTLYRSPHDAIVFGVLAGFGKYLSVDPVFLRVLYVAGAIALHPIGFAVAYVIALFLIPIDPTQDAVAQHQTPKDVTPESEPSEPTEKMDSDQNM